MSERCHRRKTLAIAGFSTGRGKGQDSPNCGAYHTLWGTLEFSLFSHPAALGHQSFMFCLPGLGWLWAQKAPNRGLGWAVYNLL